MKFDYRDFALNVPETEKNEKPSPFPPVQIEKQSSLRKLIYDFSRPAVIQKENWLPELDELEKFFSGVTLPDKPMKLTEFSTIMDISLFLETNFKTARANNGKSVFLPCISRLQILKQILNKLN